MEDTDKIYVEKQPVFMTTTFNNYLDRERENMIKRKKLKDELPYFSGGNFNYLDECLKIADFIFSKAIYSKERDSATLIGIMFNKLGYWDISPLDCSIYQGLTGIALFYLELYKESKLDKYYDLYKKIMKFASDKSIVSQDISAYFGRCSLIFPLLDEYMNSGNADIIGKLDEILKFIDENISKINEIDLLRGTSGVIISILNCFDILKDQKYLNLAIKLGEYLLNQLSKKNLADISYGMEHGASGISLSLFRLSSYIDKPEFKFKAIELLEHDRKVCNLNIRSWCYGTSGIGLSRLEIKKYYHDDEIDDEINKYINLAIDDDEVDDCVCHGNLSTLEFLLSYNYINHDENISKIIKEKFDRLIFMKENLGSYGVDLITGFYALGLFVGVSGVGYEFLRFLNPGKVPNILTLAF